MKYYTREELLSRPIEQVLEAMTCEEVGQALGVKKSRAAQIRREPFIIETLEVGQGATDRTGLPLVGEKEIAQLRAWLATA